MMLSRMNFLSPDSVCYSFDDRANGYARGEGVIVIVLKRLTDALDDGDTIRAVIRSSGTNQDGRTPGLTQPSGSAQEQLIRSVYAKAGLDLALTRYVEAHGEFHAKINVLITLLIINRHRNSCWRPD
jgi:acyl transferase domain-containing protein